MVVTTKQRGIWLASPRGKVQRRLTRGDDTEPTFSPDGRKVAFQRMKRNHRAAIMTVDVASGRTRQVFASPRRAQLVEAPVWSDDGRWIAFLHDTSRGGNFRTDIDLVRPNGSGRRAVHRVSDLTNVPTLAWSRNGECIAYQWGEFGNGALAIRNRDFSEGVNLLPFDATMPDGAEAFIPESVAFGADGKLLYVMLPVTVDGEEFDSIYAMHMDRPAPPELAVDHAGIPVPSPDGRSLAYYDFDERVPRIRKLSQDGRGRRLKPGIAVWDWTAAR